MSEFWDRIIAKGDCLYTAEHFESAAYRLITEQVLYRTDRDSRVAYGIVQRYEADFQRALAPLGVTVKLNTQLHYVYAEPANVRSSTATKKQTLLALVLRKIYDDAARTGGFSEEGEVECGLDELQQIYRLATGQELPAKGEFDALMRTMKRWGIARLGENTEESEFASESGFQPYIVVIRPGIADVLGEAAMQRLALWLPVPGEDAPEATEQPATDVEEE